MRFQDERFRQHAWVIMPNHVHMLVSILGDAKLQDAAKGWKGTSARGINRLTNRNGAVWEKDYFDRLIRDSAHVYRCAQYIRTNPAKARLRKGEYLLWESAAVCLLLDEA